MDSADCQHVAYDLKRIVYFRIDTGLASRSWSVQTFVITCRTIASRKCSRGWVTRSIGADAVGAGAYNVTKPLVKALTRHVLAAGKLHPDDAHLF